MRKVRGSASSRQLPSVPGERVLPTNVTAPRRILILGLGNTILGDDGVGISVVREIRKTCKERPFVECVEASLGGIALLDLIAGFDKVIVIDAVMADDANPAGFVYDLALGDLGDVVHPHASHALDLQTTVELGKRLGQSMPSAVKIYAIKIEENTVFREGLTPPVEEAVSRLARRVIDEIERPWDHS
jgi:hydrogenase maturation protease